MTATAKLTPVTLSRQRVAREEIDQAIDILFAEGSSIAVNVLAWAANDVLRGVARKHGSETFHDTLEKFVPDDQKKLWRDAIRESYWFMKHSDRDPDRTIDFYEESSVVSLFLAVTDYRTVYGKYTLPMTVFISWFGANHSDLLKGNSDHSVFKAMKMFEKDKSLKYARQILTFGRSNMQAIAESLGEVRLENHIEMT